MIGNERVIAVVAARGGSKGLPRKNVRPLGGRPLIGWTIAAALQARHIDRVILSSDDAEIIDVARREGCDVPFTRPAELAADDTSMLDVLHHAIALCGDGFEWIVLLQATSPLRDARDIDASLAACQTAGAPACVTVTPTDKSPHWMFFRDRSGHMRPVIDDKNPALRRQDLPGAYVLNGAVYVARREWLTGRTSFLSEQTISHVMPRERSVDIDTEMDFQLAQMLLSARSHETV